MNKEHLALANQLAPNRRGHLLLAIAANEGENRVTLFGRGGQGRHFTDARYRHLERSRNRRSRHRKHVDVQLHGLELLFVLDSEALFFVDDDEPEVSELHVFAEQPVGSDNHVDGTGGEFGKSLLHLFIGLKTRERSNRHRKAGEARLDGIRVLTNQQSGRHEHGHLLAILNCFEGSANRNLGFAVTNVAGEKAIHGYFRFHVALNFFDGGELIGSLDKRESLFEFALPRSVWAEGVTARLHSHRIQLDQVNSNLAHSLARVALDARPIATTHLAEHRRFAADILGQIVELIDRHKQGVARMAFFAWRIFDQQVFALVLPVAAGAGDQLVEAADAVNLVHHVVAGLEGQRVNHLPALGR